MAKQETKTYAEWQKELLGKEDKNKKMTKQEFLELKKKEHTKLRQIFETLNKAGLWLTRNARAGNIVGFEKDENGDTQLDRIGRRALESPP